GEFEELIGRVAGRSKSENGAFSIAANLRFGQDKLYVLLRHDLSRVSSGRKTCMDGFTLPFHLRVVGVNGSLENSVFRREQIFVGSNLRELLGRRIRRGAFDGREC